MVLLGFLATGCVHRVYRDPAFTRPSIEAGGLAMGAVTALGGGEYVAAEAVASAVQKEFQTARPWLTIVPLAETRKGVDPARYAQRLRKVSEGSGWTSRDFEVFANLAHRPRFILVIDVQAQGDAVQTRVYDEHYYPDYYGGYHEYNYNPSASAQRWIKALFLIYDFQTAKPVWVATGTWRMGAYRHLSGPGPPDFRNAIGIPSIAELIVPIARHAGRRLPR